MRKTKCLFTVLFALMAFLFIGVGSVNAAGTKEVGTFAEFKNVILNAYGYDTVKLVADINATDTIKCNVTGDTTLDLNGFSINSEAKEMFSMLYYRNYTLKIMDSSDSGTGSINHNYDSSDGYMFYVDSAYKANATFIIDGINLNEECAQNTTSIYKNDNTSDDKLIVKNANIKSSIFSNGFDSYEFSNVVLKPAGNGVQTFLAYGNSNLFIEDILGEDQEVYYQKYSSVGTSEFENIVAEPTLPINDLWTSNYDESQDSAIIVRYKPGFTVSNVDFTETYGYTATAQEISIKNRGISDLQIKDVSVDSNDFEIMSGFQTILSAGAIDTTWKIKAKDNLGAGTYADTITVTDMSGNTYTANVTLEVNFKELTGLGIDGVNSTITYGEAYTPELTGTTELGDGDYEIKYAQKDGENYSDIGASQPTDVGEYKVTITVTNQNYTASDVSVEFKIVAKSLTDRNVTLDTTSYTYTGDEIKPTVTVKDEFLTGKAGENLIEGTDYTVEYENNKNVGTGKIRITAIRNFKGTVEKEFTINKKEITLTIEDISDVTYNGSEHTPEPVVRNGSTKLVKGVDYIVEYRNNINAGTAWIEVSPVASSNYTFATVNKSFKIAQYVIQETDVTLEYESTTFNNTAKEPSVTVKMGTELIEPTEYDVTYSDNTNAGTAKVTVMIKYDSVNFTGTVFKNFEIVAKTQLTISGISYQEVVYTGKPVKLVGNLTVSNGIDQSALTTKWYRDSTDLGFEPINTGAYKVVYSYEDDTYIGYLEVNFKIISATPKITLGNLYQYVGNVTKVTYTLEPNCSLANIAVYYKVEGADDSAYTRDLPTEKGKYTVKAELEGGFINLNYAEQTATLTIAKKSTGGGTSSSVKTYKITVKENENATITPNGTVKVERGDNQTFKIKAKDGYKIEDVLVDNESVGAVSEYTFEKVREDHTIEVKVSKVEETTYVDVSENSWYKEAVNYVTKKGLMNGTGNDEFSPNVTTTRGMIVTILYRLENSPETKKATFTDVKATDYFAKAVAWAEENEIVNGYGEGKFGPNDAITREQLAVILYRYSNYKKYDVSIGENTNILSYNDVSDLAEYAIPAMQWACGEELIKGMDNGMLSPRESATRAQVATILMRFCERYVK